MDKGTTALTTTPQLEGSFYDTTPEGRYRRDAAFHTIVDALEGLIHRCKYTPTELREAALLASIHYEAKQVVSCTIDFEVL